MGSVHTFPPLNLKFRVEWLRGSHRVRVSVSLGLDSICSLEDHSPRDDSQATLAGCRMQQDSLVAPATGRQLIQ